MPGLFQGLEIGRSALLTHQLALQTISNNIANVNTPGYSRQRVNITTALPEYSTIGILGSGVTVSDVQQARDMFLGQQYRQQNKSLGQWQYKEKVYTEIESLFNEPNDSTLSDLMNKFWDSWSDLSTSPDSASSRSQIVEQAKLLTNGFHTMADQLNSLRSSIDGDMTNLVQEVNRITTNIAGLNQQISSLELGSSKANDLRDSRDLLLDQLSQIIDVNSKEQPNGSVTVYLGSMSLVNGADSIKIGASVSNVDGTMIHNLVWQGTKIALKNNSGQLAGLMEARDKIIPGYLDKLNNLAATFVSQVNGMHRSGYGLNGSTGVDFFNPNLTDAANIEINGEVASDPSKVVASASGEPGDNTIALAISALRSQGVMDNGTTSMNDYYNSVVGALGVESNQAQTASANSDLLVQQVDYARQSVQGVSLDEEMTNMIKYQHAYDAAARVITAMDQALDTVISGMGVVGR